MCLNKRLSRLAKDHREAELQRGAYPGARGCMKRCKGMVNCIFIRLIMPAEIKPRVKSLHTAVTSMVL